MFLGFRTAGDLVSKACLPIRLVSHTFTWQTSNTKEAACFASMGFTYSVNVTENCINDEPTGDVLATWSIHDKNVELPSFRLQPLLKLWESGGLDPMHPMKWRWRACQNFEALRDVQRIGGNLQLRAVCEDRAFECVPGMGAVISCEDEYETGDMNLAAALSVIGVPVIKIEGGDGRRVYTLPRYGHPRMVNGEFRTEDVFELTAREIPGKLDLVIERTRPDHPVVHAYNALHVWAQLRREFAQIRKHMLLQFPRWTQRQAVISECADRRVRDKIRQHLKLPPRLT